MQNIEPIKKEILKMREKDQNLRQQSDVDWEEIQKLDQTNTQKMKRIIEKWGVIDIPRFGEEVSKAAWVLVQHAPKNEIEFMEKYLNLMRDAGDDVVAKNCAYLEDRIRVYRNEPQIYGTQLVHDKRSDRMMFYEIEDVENVDEKRSEVGLFTLKEYSEKFNPSPPLPEDYT